MFGFSGGFGGGYGGGYPGISNQPFYGSYPSFNQGFGGNRSTSLEGIASLVNMFAQMSPEQFDTGIARLAQFKDVYNSSGFGGMGGGGFSGQSLFSSSPLGVSNFRQPSGLGMPFGNSIRQGSVNAPSFLSPASNPLSSSASLVGDGVTRTLQGPGGQSMQVLANDPRFSGKSEADIQQMVFGPPQGLSSLQEQQRRLSGGSSTGGLGGGQLSPISQFNPDVLQKLQEKRQRIADAVPAGFVANSVLNPRNPFASIGQAIPVEEGYTNPQTGEQVFISSYGDNIGEITRRIAAPEGYQPREVPSPFQGLAKLRR